MKAVSNTIKAHCKTRPNWRVFCIQKVWLPNLYYLHIVPSNFVIDCAYY